MKNLKNSFNSKARRSVFSARQIKQKPTELISQDRDRKYSVAFDFDFAIRAVKMTIWMSQVIK